MQGGRTAVASTVCSEQKGLLLVSAVQEAYKGGTSRVVQGGRTAVAFFSEERKA